MCKRLGEKGRLIGIDQDADAIKAAGERLREFGDQVAIVRSNYCNMRQELQKLGIDRVDGIVLDLGVSSYQLDSAERGFTYREDAPLDMRMDQRQLRTARDIVNGYTEPELFRGQVCKEHCQAYCGGQREETHRDYRRTYGDYQGRHSCKGAHERRPSGEKDLSGYSDRIEWRT